MVHRKELEPKTFLNIIIAYKNSRFQSCNIWKQQGFLHLIVWCKSLNALIQPVMIWFQGHWKVWKVLRMAALMWEQRTQASINPSRSKGSDIRVALVKKISNHTNQNLGCAPEAQHVHACMYTQGLWQLQLWQTNPLILENNSHDSHF